MRFMLSLIAGLALAVSVPAAAAVAVGATVKDTKGGVVGTITRVEGGNLVLKTDRHDVTLPVAELHRDRRRRPVRDDPRPAQRRGRQGQGRRPTPRSSPERR